MAHSKADVVQSRVDLLNAIKNEIDIHRGYIAALENARRGMEMVAAQPDILPLREEDGPAAKSFIKNLSDKIATAGNGP